MCRSKNNFVPMTFLIRQLGAACILALGVFMSASVLAQPANDNFSSAQPLQGPSGSVAGNNDSGTLETGEPSIGVAPGGASIWYTWTAPNGGAYTFSTLGSAISDTVLGIYTGNAV